MSIFTYTKAYKAWRSGVAHVTLDPEGPGVARLHLIPPKPSLFSEGPSQLLINGTYLFPLGPSWSILLRAFIEAIETYGKPGTAFSEALKNQVDEAVYKVVRSAYPMVSKQLVTEDLQTLLSVIMGIAKGEPVPEALGGNVAVPLNAMSAPHRMDLMVAPMSLSGVRACPLDCAACYAQAAPMMAVEAALDTASWLKIIDRCRGAGIPMLTFTGGEPLTRPDLVQLVAHAEWFVTRINTSGVGLTPELAMALRVASLDGIQFTLYANRAEVHDALVGRQGAFAQTIAGIENAVAAGLEVSINTPLVSANADYLPLIDLAHQLGVCHLTCSGLIPVGGAMAQLALGEALTPEALVQILAAAVKHCNSLGVNLSFTSPGWLSAEQLLAIGLPSAPLCGAGASNMAISPLGEVVPCQSWLDGTSLGNMLEIPWRKIWKHAKTRELRASSALKPVCALDQRGDQHE